MNDKPRLILLFAIPALFLGVGAFAASMATTGAKKAAPVATTLLEAVLFEQDDLIIEHVLDGDDPGQAITLRRAVFHWNIGDNVSPLLIAVAQGRPRRVAFLLRYTDKLEEVPNDQSLCVAARYRHSNVTRLLTQAMKDWSATPQCNGTRSSEDV